MGVEICIENFHLYARTDKLINKCQYAHKVKMTDKQNQQLTASIRA